ncbi:RCC1 domain-containing protein [Pseudomonas botevensis]|uniref:hypothetical protein n=1 Tax=Pseudomonas botevensis TaxID=2842352 RepID=UPI001C3CDAFA|nr:hypothetical protein [Pseudomonas botevensis]MBV4476853.1 hypothetical protein [Pseudomonas botevensis]
MNMNVEAIPTVKQVAVMGEPLVGGTVSGSYLYENPDENPEGASVFRWYKGGADGSVIANTLDLTLTAEHSGISLVFSVTPVAASGEQGVETFSDPVEVIRDGFQNISDEESENSFLKQRGQFAFHAEEPKDRVFTSTAGAFALKNRLTQNVMVVGTQAFGGTVPPELVTYLQNNPAITMFSTQNSFGALVPVLGHNQLLVWGPGIPAALPNLQDIRSVYSNGSSLAFIYEDPAPGENTIGAVGTAATGGEVPVEIQNKLMFDRPRAIYATLDAFAVLTEAGRVYVWGAAANGGSIPVDIQTQLNSMKVQRIVASRTAFCAVTASGEIIGWGANGVIPAAALEKIYDDDGALNVIANDSAFVTITKGRRKAVTWGLAAHGGTMSEYAASLAARGNLALCTAAPWAMCLINESGQAAAWGSAAHGGGDIPAQGQDAEAVDLPLNAQALLEHADVETQIEAMFSNARFSKSLQSRVGSRVTLLDGEEIQLVRNDGSFVLLSRHPDGRTKNVVAWGVAAAGGTIPGDVKQTLMASRIRKIFSSNGAYAALVDQGMTEGVVVAWGRATQDGGTIPDALRSALSGGVVELYTIQAMPVPNGTAAAAFAARKSNNKYVTWGAHVKNEEFDPSV